MIIAAYAGSGKTTFAERYEEAIDVPNMPYRWILPVLSEDERKNSKELEGEKGAYSHHYVGGGNFDKRLRPEGGVMLPG